MSAKRFESLHDFCRFGMNIHLTCSNGHCPHTAVIDCFQADNWRRVWGWPGAFEAGVMRHFVCSKCGARSPHPRPIEKPATLVDFFPADDRAWKRLRDRIRR